ncbi:hypothetical protein CDL15_Pgr006693 [Punica granatum]|uniref:Uncharacterized protein n=1 Tax=Punica granatum TaxID=22663 RepID=A0A218X6U8_PUNGR|nr:hypothetical protein CDL15_Pgr006693 [Punica granatum]PKI45900.1 hypothetical protein CRG98_033699 [Punica granatum]
MGAPMLAPTATDEVAELDRRQGAVVAPIQASTAQTRLPATSKEALSNTRAQGTPPKCPNQVELGRHWGRVVIYGQVLFRSDPIRSDPVGSCLDPTPYDLIWSNLVQIEQDPTISRQSTRKGGRRTRFWGGVVLSFDRKR